MSDPTAPDLPPPEVPAEPPPPPPHTPGGRRRPLPWLTAAGFLVLAAALFLVWRFPIIPAPSTEQTDTLARQLGVLDTRVARLEQRPQPQMPDLAPLNARVTALEQRPAMQNPAAASSPSLAPLEARIAALEQRQPPTLQPLESRLAALEARQAQADSELTGRITALETAGKTAQADLSHRLDAVEARMAASDKRASRTALVQSATLALSAGQALGDLPGAPPALARFANASPPTEAGLRAEFPQDARKAMDASRPATEGKPLLTRLWAQAQELVTVRQGDRVLVGDPTAGVLERARTALESGDLAAAVAEVASLQGTAGQAMAGWLAQARALLAARAALTTWAAAG